MLFVTQSKAINKMAGLRILKFDCIVVRTVPVSLETIPRFVFDANIFQDSWAVYSDVLCQML